MNLLTPDPGLLFWMVISFVIVFFLLAKFGFPVITGAIKKRQEFIELSLQSAKEANARLSDIQAEGERLLADAKAKQQQILADAMTERQQILAKAEAEATERATQIAEAAAQRIQSEKEAAMRDVRTEVADLAIKVAEMIVREKVGSDEAQRKAVSQMVENLK